MKNKILGMGGLKSLAIAAAACAFFASGSAQAAFETYLGNTMSGSNGGFDFSYIRPYDAQYGPSSLGVERDIASSPIAFEFNDSDGNGLDSGDQLRVLSSTFSLGNIGGSEVTITVGGASSILTVGSAHNFSGDSPQASHLIGGDIEFTITRGSTSFSDYFSFSTSDQSGSGPANGIAMNGDSISVWIRGISSDRMCEWNTSNNQCDGGNSILDPGTSSQIDLAEDLFYEGCEWYNGSNYCSHYFKKQYIKTHFAFTGSIPPGGNFPMPEPGSLAIFGAGLLGIGMVRRRRMK